MATDFDVAAGDVRLRVTGLRKTLRALEAAGADAEDLKGLMHRIGMTVVADAKGRVPVKTGRLRDSIRAGRGKTKSVVYAGGRRALYAPYVHYGIDQPKVPYLADAIAAKRATILQQLDDGIAALLVKNDLK
ncbi:Bacteriophage HK97-gp10, putative tail-component [Micrococcales bacterium KH10]|nr:Bacteriophage HK97-gp10, putative tail-component [Micrococcales bacterium KH10]